VRGQEERRRSVQTEDMGNRCSETWFTPGRVLKNRGVKKVPGPSTITEVLRRHGLLSNLGPDWGGWDGRRIGWGWGDSRARHLETF
jgi:hypothetical protein